MIALNNFYIGESVSFMKQNILDNFIDLTVTSPPYDNLRTYKGFVFDYQSMFKELYRVTKEGGIVVWVVGDATIKGSETGTSFKHALYAKEIGFNLLDTMIYLKTGQGATGSNLAYWQNFEYMFVLTKGKIKCFNPIMDRKNVVKPRRKLESQGHRFKNGDKKGKRIIDRKEYGKRFNTWIYSTGGISKDFNHPAVFPEKLANDHIISWSNENDIILDPMCGSGTVAKMAYLNKRNFIGIDISEEYINKICIPRLEQYGWNNEIQFENKSICEHK